jgi:hypothetical protein
MAEQQTQAGSVAEHMQDWITPVEAAPKGAPR